MPTPARRAAVVARIAAPGYARDPATTPTTPRVYLCASAVGTGHSPATSLASSRTTAGLSSSESPMSTTSTRPARRAAGGSRSPGFAPPNVTVRSASRPVPDAVPSSTPMPDGTSTATTNGSPTSPSTISAARPRSPAPSPPMPTSPSRTRSATTGRSTTRPPARSNAARPPSCTRSLARTARTSTPRRASSAPAYRASPPLLPEPARTSTRRTADPPAQRRERGSTRARAARTPRAPSAARRRPATAARRLGPATTSTTPARAHPVGSARAVRATGNVPGMRFGLFIPQGWRQDLTGIEPRDHWQVMNGLAQHADEGDAYESIWVYDHFHSVPEPPTARPCTRPGA